MRRLGTGDVGSGAGEFPAEGRASGAVALPRPSSIPDDVKNGLTRRTVVALYADAVRLQRARVKAGMVRSTVYGAAVAHSLSTQL